MFNTARTKLTLGYTAFFTLVLLLFSLVFYSIQIRTISRARRVPTRAATGAAQGRQRQLERSERDLDHELGERFSDVTEQLRKDVLRTVIIFDLSSILFFLVVSYYLAGKTLKPLEKSYSLQQQFLQDASHELRTPLTVMRAEVDLALKKRGGSIKKEVLQSLREEIKKMTQLVTDILFLARTGVVKKSELNKKTELAQVVKKVFRKFQARAKEKNINFELKVQDDAESLMVRGEKQQWEQVVSILLDNAIKYTKKDGRVSCVLAIKSSAATLVVRDTGLGLSSAEQKKVFDRFYRSESARSSNGSGLGLSIAKVIVERSGGQISVQSEKGKGADFKVVVDVIA